MTTDRTKPLGIILVILYTLIGGFGALFVGALAFVGVTVGLPAITVVYMVMCTAIGIFSLAAVYGLWTLQPWGLKLAFWLYVVSIPFNIIAIFPVLPGTEFTTTNTVMAIVAVALAAWVILYLSRLEVALMYEAL